MTPSAASPSKERLREYLDSTRRQLFDAVSGLTEEQMRRQPGGGQWSVAEILAHLPVSERHIGAQALAVRARPGAAITFLSEEERAEAASRGRRLPPPALVHDLVAARWETSRLLDGLRAREMSRTGRHAEMGEMTVAQVIGAISYHERQHVEQIQAVRQTLGL